MDQGLIIQKVKSSCGELSKKSNKRTSTNHRKQDADLKFVNSTTSRSSRIQAKHHNYPSTRTYITTVHTNTRKYTHTRLRVADGVFSIVRFVHLHVGMCVVGLPGSVEL